MMESQLSKGSITFQSHFGEVGFFFPHKPTYFPQIDDMPPLNAFPTGMNPGVSCEPQAKAMTSASLQDPTVAFDLHLVETSLTTSEVQRRG